MGWLNIHFASHPLCRHVRKWINLKKKVEHVCSFSLLEDPAEVVVVGGADGASSIPACFAEAGSVSEAGLDSDHTGAADER